MKSTTREDFNNPDIPKKMYNLQTRKIEEWDEVERPDYRWHHNPSQQKIRHNPELKKILEIIYLPTFTVIMNANGDMEMANMHAEADNYHSKFEERWGVPLEDVMYRD